jgi:hypothetical protein
MTVRDFGVRHGFMAIGVEAERYIGGPNQEFDGELMLAAGLLALLAAIPKEGQSSRGRLNPE